MFFRVVTVSLFSFYTMSQIYAADSVPQRLTSIPMKDLFSTHPEMDGIPLSARVVTVDKTIASAVVTPSKSILPAVPLSVAPLSLAQSSLVLPKKPVQSAPVLYQAEPGEMASDVVNRWAELCHRAVLWKVSWDYALTKPFYQQGGSCLDAIHGVLTQFSSYDPSLSVQIGAEGDSLHEENIR